MRFKGEWGSTAADADPPPPEEDISQIRETLATLSREFRVLISVLLTDLAWQGDTEMRFLGIRLNYNEVWCLKISVLTRDRSINWFGEPGGEITGGKSGMCQRKSQKIRAFEKKGRPRLFKSLHDLQAWEPSNLVYTCFYSLSVEFRAG